MAIRNLLVHLKDKMNTEKTADCVYRIPCTACTNCQKVYIGETGQSFGVRTKEHCKQEVCKYTRSTKRQVTSEQNKSAITDHVNTENHVINRDEATVIARESDQGGC